MKSLLPAAETDYSEKSHQYEAVWIAAGSMLCCDLIVQKIFHTLWPEDVQDGLREEDRVYLYQTAVALGEGTLGSDDSAGFQRLFLHTIRCEGWWGISTISRHVLDSIHCDSRAAT